MKKHSILYVFVILLLQSCNLPDDSFIDLKASVKNSGTQIIIKNNDSFEYQDLIIEINKEYKAKYTSLMPGEVLEIGFLKFTDGNHTKFNPFTTTASNITITCNIKNGRKGFLYGEMN
jgi:hypothetical protein